MYAAAVAATDLPRYCCKCLTHHTNSQRKKAKDKKGEGATNVGAVKTERKTARNAQKAERRAERALAGDEDDIDALLAQFALQEKVRVGEEAVRGGVHAGVGVLWGLGWNGAAAPSLSLSLSLYS